MEVAARIGAPGIPPDLGSPVRAAGKMCEGTATGAGPGPGRTGAGRAAAARKPTSSATATAAADRADVGRGGQPDCCTARAGPDAAGAHVGVPSVAGGEAVGGGAALAAAGCGVAEPAVCFPSFEAEADFRALPAERAK